MRRRARSEREGAIVRSSGPDPIPGAAPPAHLSAVLAPAQVHSPPATLRERAACVCYGRRDLRPLWRDSFGSPPVRSWLHRFRYEADVDSVLAGQRFERAICDRCGMSFHRWILDDEWLNVLYGRWISAAQIEAFEQARTAADPGAAFTAAAQSVKHLLRLRHLAGERAPIRLLDFGCGDGRFLRMAAAFGFDAHGVDLSATRRSRADGPGIRVVPVLDAVDADPFDAVTLFEVLEHVPDPLGLLRALAGRLRAGGLLLVEVPDCTGITVPRTFAEFHAVQPLEHVNTFTPRTLGALCVRAGFAPLPRVPANVTTNPIAVLRTEATRLHARATTSRYFRKI